MSITVQNFGVRSGILVRWSQFREENPFGTEESSKNQVKINVPLTEDKIDSPSSSVLDLILQLQGRLSTNKFNYRIGWLRLLERNLQRLADVKEDPTFDQPENQDSGTTRTVSSNPLEENDFSYRNGWLKQKLQAGPNQS
ncbi:hypothetical protein GE061_001654 [Apolygus lucorum]|uniref:Uncharacterized protein n=1 Tax=Apolygus lucorum TaxID=248454 RepID=A0A6A4KL15_APOLU|nr:hypothetical protein GE061_001654 [Apolygus lucorum]